jgi:hypothetical protein
VRTPHSEVYSVLKSSEGGMGQQHALFLLREANITCKPETSIYIGHSAVRVLGGTKVQRRAAKILFGSRL